MEGNETAGFPRAPLRSPGSSLVLAAILLAWVCCAVAAGSKVVRLAAAEQPPYVGQDLRDQGYVAELVRAAFGRAGYQVDISFFPAARARSLAASGQVDGYVPVSADPALDEEFRLSAGFPGGNLGLLKRRSAAIPYSATAPANRLATLQALRAFRFGAVRGAAVAPEFDNAGFLQRDYVAQDLQNLDKLALGRIDLMVVDKYNASDLMILHRPHLIGTLEFLDPPLFRSDFHVAFSRRGAGSAALLAAFNRGLAALEQHGEMDAILVRHGLRGAKRPPRGKEVLTIGTVNNRDMVVMKSLADQFERQNPGIALEWRMLDENALRTRLMTDLSIGDGQFDVLTIGAYETPIWARRGWLAPLAELPATYAAEDLLPNVRATLTHEGKLYGLPFYGESSMTFYRTDLFRQAGLKMPEQPTYTDIRRFAEILHDPGHGVYGICLRGKPGWGENMAFITTMVNSFGGRWFDETWQPEIDSRPWRQAVGLYGELLTRFGPPGSEKNGFNENLELFASGHCAQWIDATVAAGLLANPKTSRIGKELGLARAPAESATVGANWLWVWSLAIPVTTPRKAAAQRFIEWATSAGYVKAVARKEGWVAVPPGTRQSTYASADYQAAAPFSRAVLEAIRSAAPQLPGRPYRGIQFVEIPEFPAIGHGVGNEISQILTGRLTTEQALRNAQAGVLRQMVASGYLRR